MLISGTGIDMGNTPISNASQIEVQDNQLSPFTGFKNYIINGRRKINQRGLTTTDNSYNQDRWYKSGNNWYQGIEGDNNLISGKNYTLSWVGSATASYYVGTATSATINAQTFTPITNGGTISVALIVSQNLWIKFASDATGSTFNFVQLEESSVATPFEHRSPALELALCQRYYEVGIYGILNIQFGTSNVGCAVNFKTIKRVTPTVTRIGAAIIQSISIHGFEFFQNTTANNWADGSYTASAEL